MDDIMGPPYKNTRSKNKGKQPQREESLTEKPRKKHQAKRQKQQPSIVSGGSTESPGLGPLHSDRDSSVPSLPSLRAATPMPNEVETRERLEEIMNMKQVESALPKCRPDFVIQSDDIHCLLAFASKAQAQEKAIFRQERRTDLLERKQPRYYATRKPWRLAKYVDSLANICISETKKEVIAIGFRHNEKNFEFIVASNDDVQDKTKHYLQNIWAILQELFKHYYKGKDLDDTPPKHSKDQVTLELKRTFRAEVIKFTFKKIQQRVLHPKKSPVFDDSVEDDQKMLKDLDTFKECLQTERGEDRNPFKKEEQWRIVQGAFMYLSKSIEKYLEKASARDTSDTVINYLRKILGVSANMNHLLSAASSPSSKMIFGVEPTFIYLPKQEVSVSLPVAKEEWLEKERDLLGYFNDSDHVIAARPTQKTEEICEKLAQQQRTKLLTQAPVHCEVKVAINLFTKQKTFKPYPYIGVSKLSCLGCSHFLESFSKAHEVDYMTKGRHSKAYFPWGFPDNCPAEQKVLDQYYESFDYAFVRWYNGFEKSTKQGTDSTPQSQLPDEQDEGSEVDDSFEFSKQGLKRAFADSDEEQE